ncbi:MAG: DUF3343 domain-containing protein [Oscillospiraceae bacterium]|nr:DUF3343 domain-containing protein [Oscillospiraceae bacterium]
MHDIILCRSMTAAQRAAKILQRAGVFASVTKAPQSANPGGCTYGVKVGEHNLDRALAALRNAGVPFGRVYALYPDGALREVGV